ncbi:MAG: tetratricopeptide repeat protein, partial [Pseudomonadota bacterium]
MPAAIATWRDILAEDSENDRALDALERLHSSRGESAELVEILRRRVELCANVENKRTLLARIAVKSEQDLGLASEAIAAYLEILDFLPDDRETLAELARLYRAAERWSDLLETDERRLTLSMDPSERALLRFEIGEILRDKLGRKEEALERFREILAENPPEPESESESEGLAGAAGEDQRARIAAAALAAVERVLEDEDLKLRAAEILKPIFASAADFPKLVNVYELEVAVLEDPRERVVRLRRIADIKERHLGDPDGALDAFARGCREALGEPELRDLLSSVQRLAIERDRIPDLVSLYRDLAPDVIDAALQRQMYLDVADLARGKLHDADLAKEYYRRVLDAQQDDTRALAALEVLYRDAGEYQALRDVLQRKADLAIEDLDARYVALVEIATICEDKLHLEEDAITAWEQVLESQPADQDATRALVALYAAKARWVELADLLERRLGFTEDVGEAVDLRFRLGSIYEQQLGDPERAIENYEAALGGDSKHAGAVAALERFLEDPALRLGVAGILEPIYIARHDWQNLIRITEIRLDAETEPQSRLSLSKRIARLYEDQLGDLDGAFRWYGKVFREDPRDRANRDQLMRLASILSRWDGLSRVYQELLDDQGCDGPELVEVAKILADIYDRRLDDVDRARSAYRRVLEAVPGDDDAFGRLEAMLTRASRWFALIEVYEDSIGNASDAERRKDRYARIAAVQEQRLSAPEKAIDAWRAVLDIDSDDERAAAELDRLYQEHNRWSDLSELLLTRIERVTDSSSANSLRVRLAEILEHRLREIGSAIDQYERALSEDRSHAAAIAALERLVLDPDQRSRIARILEPIYRTHDWWQKLVVILDAQLEYVGERGQRVAVLREIARVHESRGGDLGLALQALARAWKEDITDDEVYEDLARLAEKLGAWAELVTVLDGGVEGTYDYDLAAKLLARIARIEEERRNDRPRAIAAWRRVLEVKEDDKDALDALERLYEAERDHEALVAILLRKEEIAADAGMAVDERLLLLYRIAELYSGALGRVSEAISIWRRVLVLDDEDKAALDALEALYGRERDFRSLSEILARKIELCVDPAARRPLHFAAARIHDKELGELYEAIAQYKAVLETNPADLEALRSLDAIYEREKSWPELVEIVDREADLDRAARADLLFRAARIVEKEQEEPGQAIERYRAILACTPGHPATREELEALMTNEATLELAAAALEPVYRAENNSDALARLYERRLTLEGLDAQQRRADVTALAEVHEAGRKDLTAAFATWARYLRDAPEDTGAQESLERLSQARGEWVALADLYEQIARAAVDIELGRSLALKLAAIYEDALGELESSVGWYRQALELSNAPDVEQAPLAALDRILEQQGRWVDLAEIIEREAASAALGEEQAGFLYRLGDLRERELADVPGAVSAYREVLERVRDHQDARRALERLLSNMEERASIIAILEPLYEDDADYGRLAGLIEAKLPIEKTKEDRASLLARLVEIVEKRLGDPARAMDAAGRWLTEDPLSEQAAEELERLAAKLGNWEAAAMRLEEVAVGGVATEAMRELSLRVGRILIDELGRLEDAELAFRRVLDIDAQNLAALAALERIYRGLGQTEKLAEILWRRGEAELDVAAKRRDFAETARIREEQLGDDDGAITAWRKVLDIDEGDREGHQRLAGTYQRKEQWEQLVEVLALAARFADNQAGILRCKRTIAEVLAEKLGAIDRAIEAWRDVVDMLPDDVSALRALADVQRRHEDWSGVQDTLIRMLGGVSDPRQRVGVMEELARVAEVERGAMDDAIAYSFQILEIDNSYQPAYQGLERMLDAGKRWHELVEVLLRHADVQGTLGDSRRELEILLRVADIWEGPLANPEAAAEILERVLKRDPGCVKVLGRLAKIHEGAGDWQRCTDTLQRALALNPSGRDAAELHFRLGRLAEAQTGEVAPALPHYREALAIDPDHLGAMSALEGAARERADWEEVAGYLARREALEQEDRQVALALELASLFRDKLGRLADAVPYLEKVARAKTDDPAILSQLADAYFQLGRWQDAEPIYAKLAEKAKTARKLKDLARFQQKIGALREGAGDHAEAIKAYEEAFRVDPSHGATMAGLGRLYFAKADWERARRVYRNMLLQNLDPAVGVTKADIYFHL